MTKFHDLDFKKLPDGCIRLTQTGCKDDSVIDIHPVQLRHIAECFGLVSPTPRADEMTKLLAEQLGIIQKELASERHRSHWLELTYAKLDGFMVAMPASIFPFHLWDDDEQPSPATEPPAPKAAASSVKQETTPADSPITSTQKVQPSEIVQAGQLGLGV
ncbi:MAG: hypothetical protein RIR18_1914 [Pseudomonadota bacterium]